MTLSDDTTPTNPTPDAAPLETISSEAIRQRLTACEYLGDRFVVAVEKTAVALPDREALLFRLGQMREIGLQIESETGAICAELGVAVE